MKLNIYFEDLRKDTQIEIQEMLKTELSEEIDDAVENTCPEGLNAPENKRSEIADEVIDNYINTRNQPVEYEI